MRREGVSEIVSASLLLVIAVTLAVIVMGTLLPAFSAQLEEEREQLRRTRLESRIRLRIVHVYYDPAGILEVHLYNYGELEARVDRVYVDYTPYLVDRTITRGAYEVLRVNATLASGSHVIIVATKEGRTFEARFEN